MKKTKRPNVRVRIAIAVVAALVCGWLTLQIQTIRWLNRAPSRMVETGLMEGVDYDRILPLDEWIRCGHKIPMVELQLRAILRCRFLSPYHAAAIFALYHVGTEASLPEVRSCLDGSEARFPAIAHLGWMRDSESLAKLEKIFLTDKDTNIRANAILAVARIGGSKVEPFISAATNDPDAFVAMCAREGLEDLLKKK